jgi:hypothetical protein
LFSGVFTRVNSGFNHFQSVIHDPRARFEASSSVGEEVDAAWQHLRSLRNALAPISLLPPKVLARVFHFLSLEDPPGFRKQKLGWIRATHVCRLWRQVALGDSSLWARISGTAIKTEWIPEMLARATNVLLDIDVDLGRNRNPEVLLMFPSCLSQTRKLSLHGVSKLHSDGFRGICTQEAPALEHFEFEASVTSLITFRELGGTTLFKGQAPKLRTLILSQVLIPWSHIPRGQLTQLTICLLNEVSIADVPSHRDLNELIDLLVNSPSLEVLALEFCLPSYLSQLSYDQTIHLPQLSRLCLGGSSSRVTNLLKMLELPTSTMLHLHCVSENTLTHNDHLLLPVVSAHFQSPTPVEFKKLNVTFSYLCRMLEVTASTSIPTSRIRQSQDFECGIVDGDADFVLSFDGLPEHGHWTGFIDRVCKMLPISNLEFLSISSPDVVASVNWVDLFKRCPKVTAVQAIGCGASGLVRALNTIPHSGTRPNGKGKKKGGDNRDGMNSPAQLANSITSRAHAPVLPKLTFLSLKRLDFAKNMRASGILFDVVQKGLRQRKEAYRAPLEILRIDNCAISADRAKALQKLVEMLLWDGKVFVNEFEGFDAFVSESEDFDGLRPLLGFFFDGSTYGEQE